MPEELFERHIQQFNDTQNRYRYDAHIALRARERLTPILGGRFQMGQPLDPDSAFCETSELHVGTSMHFFEKNIPAHWQRTWVDHYNQAVGLQGLEVADVHAESRSQEDTGGSFSGNRLNRG